MPAPAYDPSLTTHDNLARRGLTHRPPTGRAFPGTREVVDAEGVVAFVGTCGEVNDWMAADMAAAEAHADWVAREDGS